MNKPSFQEWFSLKEGRKNFQIDPVQDQAFLFGEPTWEAEIDSRLAQAQALGTPVRVVWWGQFGIGKTHRLRHTEYLIRKNSYQYHTCYVVASDVQEKTGFDRLHYELINALKREEMRSLVSSYLLKLRNQIPGIPQLTDICGNSGDVAPALRGFGSDNENMVLPAWRFLSGLKLKGNDLALAGVTKDGLDSSNDFSAVLGAFATIIQLETGKELLYLIDEMENLTKVTNKTAEARWQESLRAMLDIKNLSFVATVGAERMTDLPKIILQPDIVRRVGRDNYLTMEAYKAPVAKSFVKGLLGNWIDPSKRDAVAAAEKFEENIPDYDSELYPFTAGGFEKFCDYAVVDPRTAKPSEIIARMNHVAFEAFFRNRRLINRDHLTEMGIA